MLRILARSTQLSRTSRVALQVQTPAHVRPLSTVADASGLKSQISVVLGSQWGDEGKGKLADVLAKDYDVITRFNGGNNAGHTIVANGHKFAFHLLPCGLIYPHTVNVLGNGVVVNLDALFNEMKPLEEKGISTKGRIKVSNRAHLLFDFHQDIDALQETSRGKDSIGTTRKGIGPCYSLKMSRANIRVGELKDWEAFQVRFRALAETVQNMYGIQVDVEAQLKKIKQQRDMVIEDDMIVDSVHFINDKINSGARVLSEGANAAMLDIDFGTYPYVTSSTTTSGGIATGLGVAPQKLESVLGVVKAYTTRVGLGPFPTELTDDLAGGARERGSFETDIGAHLQNVGAEIGVTTGRKRRCGWLDTVVLNYSHMVNGFTGLNLTKLDVLNDLKEVKIGVAYKLNGEVLPEGMMPSELDDLSSVEVVYETMPGWQSDISKITTFEELPPNCQAYVNRIEELVKVPISWIGVGPKREEMILKK